MKKQSPYVILAAFWILLSTSTGIFNFIEKYPLIKQYVLACPDSMAIFTQYSRVQDVFPPVLLAEWFYDILAIFCAFGLFLSQEWARRLSMKVLVFYFLWVLYYIYFLVRPFFVACVQWYSQQLAISQEIVKLGGIILMVVQLIWPVLLIFILSHPNAKFSFISKK